jgi:hypothetical protein
MTLYIVHCVYHSNDLASTASVECDYFIRGRHITSLIQHADVDGKVDISELNSQVLERFQLSAKTELDTSHIESVTIRKW